ncbi:MAG: hypothetical protein ACOY4H_01830 [Thermodesulfobacteriota bacterium]
MVRCMILVFLLLLVLSGCAALDQQGAAVETGSPVVYIHPVVADLQKFSVMIPPFLMPTDLDTRQGERVAALFQDVLLGKQAFRRIIRTETPYRTLEEARRIGREAGVDFVLAGQVHTLLSATTLGGGRVDVAVRVIEVASGDTVWYIQQAVNQQMAHPDLSLSRRLTSIFSLPPVRPAEGAPVAVNMLVHVAFDMADVMAGARSVAAM